MLRSFIDTALDRTLVGYTNVGYHVRASIWRWTEPPPMDGQTVLVTGATSGIGLAAAERFAGLGASVRLLARNEERGERARAGIVERTANDDVALLTCDLGDLRAIRLAAERLLAETPRLDVLVHNAGALTAQRTLSRDGIELTFATNVVGPFLLTALLTPLLEQSAPARIITVSSGGMYTQRLEVDDPQMTRGRFRGAKAYARTKRAQVSLAASSAERLRGTGVVVHAMHPGWVDTPGLRSSLPGFYRTLRPLLRTPAEGADTIVWLAAAAEPARSSGGFWHDRRQRPTNRVPWIKERAGGNERLWQECERLSGQ
jgi:dehydrogenase/reductase SDR family protein 12